MNHRTVRAALRTLENPEKGKFLAGFFKTGPGQYGEGDRFLGITVPEIRRLAQQFHEIDLAVCEELLQSAHNEERLLALVIMDARYAKADEAARAAIYRLYMKNRKRVNNWNLVDASAPYIVGAYLLKRDRAELYKLAQSASLWDRRIAIVATAAFIRQNDFADTFKLTEIFLKDEEDLMHKACGWMLREVGKRDPVALERFLERHRRIMPRTMLRYAIERFAPEKRAHFMARG